MGWEDDMVSSILRAEEDNIMAEVRRQIDAGVAASEIRCCAAMSCLLTARGAL